MNCFNNFHTGNVPYDEDQPIFLPPELVNRNSEKSGGMVYHCYLIELIPNFECDVRADNIVLVTSSILDPEILTMNFDLDVDGGLLMVKIKKIGRINLQQEVVSGLPFIFLVGYIIWQIKLIPFSVGRFRCNYAGSSSLLCSKF